MLSILLPVAGDLGRLPGRRRNVYKAGRSPFRRRRSHGRHSRLGGPGQRGGRRWPKRILIGFGALVLVLFLAAVASFGYVYSQLSSIPRMKVTSLSQSSRGGEDVLMVGSDSRSCVKTAAQAKSFGSSKAVVGQRSDTIMIARFLPSGKVEMLSIPRDTWVPIAGTTISAKINASFNYGPGDLVRTIQQNFHIPINHVVQVNFCGFPAMVNALGGIYMDFPDPVRDAYTGLNVQKTGCQLVTGSEALALVRSRHLYYFSHGVWNYDGMSDFSRIQRQHAFFRALLSRIHSVMPNIFRLANFSSALVSGLRVDSGFSALSMLSLGWRYHSLSQSSLYSSVLPTTEAVIAGQDALLPAKGPDATVISAFLAGDAGKFQAAVGLPARRIGLTSSSVITDKFKEPWNPYPC